MSSGGDAGGSWGETDVCVRVCALCEERNAKQLLCMEWEQWPWGAGPDLTWSSVHLRRSEKARSPPDQKSTH